MKKTFRLTAIIVAFCTLFFAFSGCGQKADDIPATQPPDTSPTLSDDTLVVTIEGSPVYWPEFKYWLNYSLQYCGFVPGSEIDWDSEYSSNMTLREYVMYDAVNAVALYRIIDKTAESMGIDLSDDNKASIETIMSENAAYFETEEAYQEYLEESYLTEELMEYLLEASCNYFNIFVKMFGQSGELVPDTDALAFGEENGYFRAKHILMSFTDDEGNACTEEEMQTKYAQLEDMLAQIRAADDPTALFDQYMAEFSEDPGLSSYPDGYQFVRGDMVDEFQSAVESLGDHEVSDIVTMGDYGYTIIMRLPLEPDDSAISNMYGHSLRYITANFEYEALAKAWATEANVEYSENYAYIDPADWF
ncbi:MAG: peptidylprolyl isomerase [Clostridiales bacterium]|nr:peptidylprolyl isomerase [Clostridiales bacterium]